MACVAVLWPADDSLNAGWQGLVVGETAAALAGGTNVMLTPQTSARICLLHALSPVGRCQTFDAAGDGYGRGEAFTVAYLRSAVHFPLRMATGYDFRFFVSSDSSFRWRGKW